jgi:hypothetical protein
VPSIQGSFCRLADSHTHDKAASCCPLPVPLTALLILELRRSQVYANSSLAPALVSTPRPLSLSAHSYSPGRHTVPRSAESLAFAVTSRPHPLVAYPLVARPDLDTATQQHTVCGPHQRLPLIGELRRSAACLPCQIPPCKTTRTLRACAMESPSPQPS